MKCEVLRPFRIATDPLGIQSKELNPGDTYDVPAHMVAMLEAEGYIKPAPETPSDPIERGVFTEALEQAGHIKPRKKKS